ncbi:MAG: hypothetical protein HDS38_04505 [Bacteroides sp.]|nr:hypothetical protein [Bacteroides sp.]
MNEIALIVSLNFRAAHISHLLASYRQMEELGYKSILYIDKNFIPFLPTTVDYITDLGELEHISVAIFWFPALKNINAMIKLKLRHDAKIIYIYHEPVEAFSSYLKSGNSFWWTIKYFLKYYIGLTFIKLADKIILPSKKALELYQQNVTNKLNSNYSYLPLLYEDESQYIENQNREFFSYIGGISFDHAFDKYLDFIYEYYKKSETLPIKFLIASWRQLPKDSRISEMKDAGVLTIQCGKPLTNDEINKFYASTLLVWNAYNRTTQSGVLAKSFMFGTPGLVLKKNLSEFIQDKKEVIAIESNTNFNQIKNAIQYAIENIDQLSISARSNYLKNYDYKSHNLEMKNILHSL